MSDLLNTIMEFMDENSLRYHRAEGRPTLHFGFTMDNVNLSCILDVDEERRYIGFSSSSGLKALEDKRPAMGEFVARANYGQRYGAFQFDYNDGEITFRTGMFLGDAQFDPELLHPILQANIHTYDRYYSGLVDVLYRDIAPSEAIDRIEQSAEPEIDPDEMDAVLQSLFSDMGERGDDDELPPAE